MQTLREVSRRIEHGEDMREVVSTMKSLAAVSMHQFQRAVESVRKYHETVEEGFRILLSRPPADFRPEDRSGAGENAPGAAGGQPALIILGSAHGMCGQFNQHLASFAAAHMARNDIRADGLVTLVLGEKVVPALESAGVPIGMRLGFAGSPAEMDELMLKVMEATQAWRVEEGIGDMGIVYNRPRGGTAYEPAFLRLLPLDLEGLSGGSRGPRTSRSLPYFSMPWEDLFSLLVRQLLYISIHMSLVRSLAAENASRLASMQAAEKNLEDHLEELHEQYHRLRQAAITTELLDIVTGYEALSSRG